MNKILYVNNYMKVLKFKFLKYKRLGLEKENTFILRQSLLNARHGCDGYSFNELEIEQRWKEEKNQCLICCFFLFLLYFFYYYSNFKLYCTLKTNVFYF